MANWMQIENQGRERWTKNASFLIGVTIETRELLRDLAAKHRTKIYQLVQTLAEEDQKNFLLVSVNIDREPAEN